MFTDSDESLEQYDRFNLIDQDDEPDPHRPAPVPVDVSKSRTPKQKCVAIATGYGATVEREDIGHHITINIDLPVGKVWRSNSLHTVNCQTTIGFSVQAWNDLLEDMSMGVEDCEDPLCDICHPEPEQNED